MTSYPFGPAKLPPIATSTQAEELQPKAPPKLSVFSWMTVFLTALIVRVQYVFFMTQYQDYLFSDMGGYWKRALERANGGDLAINQWVLWPPGYHILLAKWLQWLKLVGAPEAYQLEFTLLLQIFLASLSAVAVYRMAVTLLQNQRLGWLVGMFYALIYQLVYLNAFILSEAGGLPFLIAANYVLICWRLRPTSVLLSGLLLGIAVVIRPVWGTFGLAFSLYILWNQKSWRSWLLAAAFSVAFFVPVMMSVVETNRISDGKVHGLGANSGLNFYIAQCKPREIKSHFNGLTYVIGSPQFIAEIHRAKVHTYAPMYDQQYFYQLGADCIARDPMIWFHNALEIRKLFVGPLFPSMNNAVGFAILLPWVSMGLGFLLCFGALIAPLLWLWKKPPMYRELTLLWSLLLLSAIGVLFFNVERRFSIPLAYIGTLTTFSVLSLWRKKPTQSDD